MKRLFSFSLLFLFVNVLSYAQPEGTVGTNTSFKDLEVICYQTPNNDTTFVGFAKLTLLKSGNTSQVIYDDELSIESNATIVLCENQCPELRAFQIGECEQYESQDTFFRFNRHHEFLF